MISIIFSIVVYVCLSFLIWTYYINNKIKSLKQNSSTHTSVIIISILSLILRIILACFYRGHNSDMACFEGWSARIFGEGFSAFYKGDSFNDYPPGYMYVLYIVGAIRNLFNPTGGFLWLTVKSPAIIFDVLSGILVYKIATKQQISNNVSAAITVLYLFNPAVILNSSLWGQVDSVYTFFILLMLYLITQKRLIPSYFVFAISIFIKPQAFIFFPVIIFAIIENVFLNGFDKKVFTKNLLYGICAILILPVLSAPFGIKNVIDQYIQTLLSYPYLTVNAFNLWGALGFNWDAITPTANAFAYIMLAAIVVYCSYIFFKTKKDSKYYYVGALLSFMTFMLSTKMHDRYAFSTMILMLCAFIFNKDIKSYCLYIAFSISQFFNTAWVLFIYEQDINTYFKDPVIMIWSTINIILLFVTILYTQKYYSKNKAFETRKDKITNKTKTPDFKHSIKFEKLNKYDHIIMIVIIAIYSCIAFYDLGNTKSPQTYANVGKNNTVTINLGEAKDISKLEMFLATPNIDENNTLDITYLDSDMSQISTQTITDASVFSHKTIDTDKKGQYITLSSASNNMRIMELYVFDSDSQLITPQNHTDTTIANLFDEQELLPQRSSHRDSMYFDEIYHARTAYEFVHGLDVYEWTHPPLGKVLIAIGIKLFGMTPFGWRFIGTLFGVFMIPVIYIFARRMFNYKWLATLSCLLFTFDFMHFAQTRIATVDVYVTFFIMLMYMFMFKYYSMSFYDTSLKKTLIPLGLGGILMGLGIACKWTGIYAGIGLAVVFFITLYNRYREYRYALQNPDGETDGISHKSVIECFRKNTLITIIFCCVFYVVIPLLIYSLSYIPYLNTPNTNGIKTIIDNQFAMFTYHADTVVDTTHPFSSRWYEWLIIKRPVWYYAGTVSETVKEGISSFGNPAVWWVGIAALIYTVYLTLFKKDKTALFLVISYLAQLVSWIPVTRTTYIYHYFPSVPFVVMMICYSIYRLYNNAESIKSKNCYKIASFVYVGVAGILFIMFYPVLSGQPCNVDYVHTFLRWFNSWQLI